MDKKEKKKQEQAEKQSLEKQSLGNFKKLEMPVLGIIDNIVVTKTGLWAYYVISEKPYETMSTQGKISFSNSTTQALSSLVKNNTDIIDCHILMTNIPYDIKSWAEEVRLQQEFWNDTKNQAFEDFIQEQKEDLLEQYYEKRLTLLGVKIDDRTFKINSSTLFENSFKDIIEIIKKGISSVFQVIDEHVSAQEEAKVRKKEDILWKTLSATNLDLRKPSAQELLLSLKRRFYPSMPSPYLEIDHDNRIGLSDIAIETGGVLRQQKRKLEFEHDINGVEHQSYSTVLTVAQLPPILVSPSTLPVLFNNQYVDNFTISMKFKMLPSEIMKKKTKKKQQDFNDEVENFTKANQRITPALKETIRDLSTLEEVLEEDNTPWVEGTYQIILDAPTEDLLATFVEEVKNYYKSFDVVLVRQTGIQLKLFLESLLGSELLESAFTHITTLNFVGTSGFNHGNTLGDPIKQDDKLR